MFAKISRQRTFERLMSLVVVSSLILASLTLAPAASAAHPQPAVATATEQGALTTPAEGPEAIDPGPWHQQHVSLGADSAGNLFAVWEDYRENGAPHIRFAFRPTGGDWGTSVKLDPTDTEAQMAPDIALDGSGNAYAVWSDVRNDLGQIRFAYRPAGGDWGASQVISPATWEQYDPALAVNRRGEAVVAWLQDDALAQSPRFGSPNVFASTRPVAGPWNPAERLSNTPHLIWNADVALDDWGQASVIWTDWDKVLFATRPPDGPWGANESVRDSTTGTASGARIAVDSSGNVHAVWGDKRNGLDGDIYAAYRPAGGPWSVNVRVDDDPGSAERWEPAVAVDGAGNAIAAWIDYRNGKSDLYGAIRPRGGGWGPNEVLVPAPIPGAAATGRPGAEHRGRNEGFASAPQQFPSGAIALAGGLVGALFGTAFSMATMPDPYWNHNAYLTQQGAPGASGNCYGTQVALASVRDAANAPSRPAIFGMPNFCHAGNGGQEAALNGDQGFIGPPRPPEGWPHQVEARVVDGQTLYVVDTPGIDTVTYDRGEAERFAQSYHNIPWSGLTFDGPEEEARAEEDLELLGGGQAVLLDILREARRGLEAQEEDLELLGGGQAVLLDILREARRSLEAQGEEAAARAWAERTYRAEPYHVVDWVAQKIIAEMAKEYLEQTPEGRTALQLRLVEAETTRKAGRAFAERFSRADPNFDPTLRELVVENYITATPEGRAQLEHTVAEIEARRASVPEPAGYETVPATPSLSYFYGQQQDLPAETFIASRSEYEYHYYQLFADPVLPHSGEFVYQQTLLRIPGRGLDYALRLNYHSQLIYDGPLGWGWEHDYDRRVVPAGGGSLGLQEGGGRIDVYSFDGTEYTTPAGRYTALVSDTTGITLTHRNGRVETYLPLDDATAPGRLRAIADRNGNTLRFAYDGDGRLQTVTDTMGREITYSYNANDRITAVTDYTGRAVTLAYDINGDLVSITTPAVTGTPHGNDFPDGKTTRFAYTSGDDDERLNHNLTTIIAPNEVAGGSLTPRTINTYGTEGFAFDRVVAQSWGGGRANASGVPAGGEVTLVYTTAIETDAPPGAASKVTITDRGGNVIEMWHDGAGHRLRDRQVVDGQGLVTDYTYNADGQTTSVAYPARNRVEYTYDDGATDRFAQGNLLEERRVPDAARGCDGAGGTPCPDLVTTYTYEPNFQLLQTSTDARGHTIARTHDGQGNLVQVTFPTVTVGPAAPQAAVENWTYNGWGQPLTFTDTEGNVTQYEYYTSGPATGYRQRLTRDSGGLDVSTAYGYDAVGNVTAITDSLGVRTEYVFNTLNQVVKKTRAAGTALDYEAFYWYDDNDNLVRRDVENVAPDLDGDFRPTGAYSRDGVNPWLTTAYTYDLLDNLVRRTAEVTVSFWITTEYRYDPLENLVSVTDPEGNRVEYAYDERSLLCRIVQGVGSAEASTTTYEYDANGNLVRTTDGEGHRTDYVYDGFDRRVGRVDALGNVRTWEYDENGNVVATLLRDGQDGRNPGRQFDAADAVMLSRAQHRYDERNRCYLVRRGFFTADVDTGVITPFTTDGNGDGWVETAYTYDRNGNVTAITGDDGNTTQYAYDGLDRLVLRTDALSNTVAYGYDGNGNLVQTVATEHQPDGLAPDETFATTNTFDAANRLVQATDNLSQTNRFAYDSRGNLVFTSDANGPLTGATNNHGNTALFTYDGLNRRLAQTHHLRAGGVGSGAVTGQVTMAYVYDGNGNLVRRSDPNGNVTTYGYDALDRLASVTHTDGTTATLAYDRANNLVQQIDPNGSTVAYTYDALNRQVRTDVTPRPGVGGTTLQTFAWDGLSRMIAAGDDNDPGDPADDSTLEFAYDSLGNRVEETQNGHTVGRTYDGVGNRLTLTYPGGTELTYTYDGLNRVKTIADGGGELAAYDYIGTWRLFRRTNGNGTYVAYTYDGVRRVTEKTHRLSSDDSLLAGFSYTYDRVGNRLTEIAQSGDPTTYTYDSLYRLTGAQSSAFDLQYTYDAAGNRVQVTEDGQATAYATNEMNEYEAVDGESRTYDANGNLIQVRWVITTIPTPTATPTPTSTPTATPTATPTPTATVTPVMLRLYLPIVLREPLLSAKMSGGAPMTAAGSPSLNGAATVTETVISYGYNFADRLLGVTEATTVTIGADVQVTTDAVSFTYDGLGRRASKQRESGTVRYLYAAGQVIEERDGTDGLLATYVSDLTMDRGGSRVFYQADGLGNVRALADGEGNVVERVDYDPFGAPTFSGGGSESALGNPYLFRGRHYDTESGLYVYGARRYDPATGRYLQRGAGISGNRYTFAGNNPLGGIPR